MRSVSRSPRSRRRFASPERRGQPSGRLAPQTSRFIRRSRSHSPHGKGKGRSASRSASPKRRQHASFDDKRNNRRREGPCRREADSTDMFSKGHNTGLKDRNQLTKPITDLRETIRKSNKGDEDERFRSDRKSDVSKPSEKKSAAGDRKRQRVRADRKRSGSRDSRNMSTDSGDDHPCQSKDARKQHSAKNEKKIETDIDKKYKAEDQTEITMNKRFGDLEGTLKPFVPEENVSIEIERTVEGRAVPFEMPLFWSDAIVVFRRPDEGKTPLTDREEFIHRLEESEEERRTVKMKKKVSPVEPRRVDEGDRRKREQGHRRETKRGPYDRRSPNFKPLRLEEEKNILRNARDLLISMRNRDDTESQQRPAKRSVISASQVGRNYLLPAAAVMTGELPMRVNPYLNSQDRGRGRITQTNTGFGRHPADIPEPQALPDFAHRPDKYKFEEWKTRPELIPKGRSYFEHDDRDAADDAWDSRGGGRGGHGRGGGVRGRGRGGFTGPRGGSRVQAVRSDVWRHDKFQELEDSQVPSSTS